MDWVLAEVEPRGSTLDSIIALAKQNRDRLGFLPDAAFRERAQRASLVAATRVGDEALGGYVLFDLVRGEIAVRHLCVATEFRGTGLAVQLLDFVNKNHPYAVGMRLLCRRDYGLDRFWTGLGFAPRGERNGQSATGAPLTLWLRPNQTRSLFEWQPSELKAVALDTNVFRDIHEDRSTSLATREALADWIFDSVEFVVTDALFQDVNRERALVTRRSLMAAAQGYRNVVSNSPGAARVVSELRKEIRSQNLRDPGDTDLLHVAICSVAGVEILLSRDSYVREKLAALIRAIAGVRILYPEDIGAWLAEDDDRNAYAPAALEDTEISLHPTRVGQLAEAGSRFINMARGETRPVFRRLIANVAGADWRSHICDDATGQPILMTAQRDSDGHTEVGLLRIEEHSSLAVTVIRTVLGGLGADPAGVHVIRITDPCLQAPVAAALAEEGFIHTQTGWVRVRIAGVFPSGAALVARVRECLLDYGMARDGLLDELLPPREESPWWIARLESMFAPAKILNGVMENIFVPIRPAYAEDLFDVNLSREKMFSRPARLGLAREHVYYRSNSWPKDLIPPARIIWYVSTESGRASTGRVRAISQLREICVGSPADLAERFRRLGVFNRGGVAKYASRGQALAMRFVNTELLQAPISVQQLRSLMTSGGATLVTRSVARIPEDVFGQLYLRGHSY